MQYHNGFDGHPGLAGHQIIAKELTAFIKKTTSW
jgi:phospholipase/lecithinase/hemolysin